MLHTQQKKCVAYAYGALIFNSFQTVSWVAQSQITKEKNYWQKAFFYIANFRHKDLNLNLKCFLQIAKATNLMHVRLKMEK